MFSYLVGPGGCPINVSRSAMSGPARSLLEGPLSSEYIQVLAAHECAHKMTRKT